MTEPAPDGCADGSIASAYSSGSIASIGSVGKVGYVGDVPIRELLAPLRRGLRRRRLRLRARRLLPG